MIDKGLFNNGMTTSEYDYYFSKGYESPIKQIMSDIQYRYEEDCVKAVQSVGFDVDKTELTKALLYDRNQYEEGYKQGREDAINEFANALINDGKVSAMRVLKIKEQLKGE